MSQERFRVFFQEELLQLLAENDPHYILVEELLSADQTRILEAVHSYAREETAQPVQQQLILSFAKKCFSDDQSEWADLFAGQFLPPENNYEFVVKALCNVFLHGKLKDAFHLRSFPSGIPFVADQPIKEKDFLPSQTTYLLIAIFSLMIFNETGNQEAKELGLAIAAWQRRLIAKDGEILTGFWVEEEGYRAVNLYSYYYLLFLLESKLTGEEDSNQKDLVHLFRKVENLPMELLEKIDWLTFFISDYIEKYVTMQIAPKVIEQKEVEVSLDVGTLTYFDEKYHAAFSIVGKKTGIGSIVKNGVKVITFGPHSFPLGEMTGFGIDRSYDPNEEFFRDLSFQAKEEGFFFKGWTKAAFPSEEGALWLSLSVEKQRDEFRLKIRTEMFDVKKDFAFTFFLSAKTALVGDGLELSSNSLHRHIGLRESARFRGDHDEILIEPCFQTEQEIIPLAGMDHFWGADFLVSHTAKKEIEEFEWIIK